MSLSLDTARTPRRVSQSARAASPERAAAPAPTLWARYRVTELLRHHGGALALLIGAVLALYHGWLQPGVITAGDWGNTPDANMRDDWPVPPVWNAYTGGGGPSVFGLVFFPQLTLYGLLSHLGVTYGWVERLIWMYPAVLIASSGGYVLAYSLFRSRVAGVIAGLFLVCNSYIVLIDGGGQFTVGCAYAMIPFILWSFRATLYTGQGFRYVLTALLLAIQGVFDLRLTYITVPMLALYAPFIMMDLAPRVPPWRALLRLVKQGVIWAPIELFVQLPWLLPSRFMVGSVSSLAQPAGYASVAAAHGLSFMTIVNALNLMHPFWPNYPLGHPGPYDPAMFAVPLLVFALLLSRTRLNRDVLYLYLLALCGMFFVKGSNPPAGQVYDWLFLHVTGFSWFRDPSKFYQPLMVAAGLLVGYAVSVGAEWLRRKVALALALRLSRPWTRRAAAAASALWTGAWVVMTIYPALPEIASARAGTLRPIVAPADLQRLNAMIDRQPDYFGVMWYPGSPPLATYSNLHPFYPTPAVGAEWPVLRLPNTDPSSWLKLPTALDTIRALGVKYVVVPPDAPDHSLYAGNNVAGLSFQTALSQARRSLTGFRETTVGALHVFVNPSYLPLVYVPSRVAIQHVRFPSPDAPAVLLIGAAGLAGMPVLGATVDTIDTLAAHDHPDVRQVTYDQAPPTLPSIQVQPRDATRIDVRVSNATRPFMLLMLQNYNPNWQAYVMPTGTSPSLPSLWRARPIAERNHMRGIGYANAWWVDARGSFTLVLLFRPQLYVDIGAVLCWLTIIACVIYIAVASWGRLHTTAERVGGPRRDVDTAWAGTDDAMSLSSAARTRTSTT